MKDKVSSETDVTNVATVNVDESLKVKDKLKDKVSDKTDVINVSSRNEEENQQLVDKSQNELKKVNLK